MVVIVFAPFCSKEVTGTVGLFFDIIQLLIMSKQNKKHDKPVKIKESFTEAVQRISRVEKKTVDRNIKSSKDDKKGNKD
jgi:hypothetical protein